MLSFSPIHERIDSLDSLLEDMDAQWQSHDNTSSILPELLKKKEKYLQFLLVFLFDNFGFE